MNQEDIFSALNPEKLKSWTRSALTENGIKTVEMPKDDKRIESVAERIYKKILLFPIELL